jgi:hypothetical protein
MRYTGFRLRTIVIVITTLAVLMGLGETMRRGLPYQVPRGGLLELTSRAEIRIWTGQVVDPDGTIIETYLLIPLEYVLALIAFLAAPILLVANYLSLRRKRDVLRQPHRFSG